MQFRRELVSKGERMLGLVLSNISGGPINWLKMKNTGVANVKKLPLLICNLDLLPQGAHLQAKAGVDPVNRS